MLEAIQLNGSNFTAVIAQTPPETNSEFRGNLGRWPIHLTQYRVHHHNIGILTAESNLYSLSVGVTSWYIAAMPSIIY